MATGAVDLTRWIFLAGQTLALVANLVTLVVRAVESTSAGLLAREARLTAEHVFSRLATEALNLLR